MNWPSKNVPQGGVFHSNRNEFSKDTAKFLRELINESKLSIPQKNKFEYMLRNGSEMPEKPRRPWFKSTAYPDVTFRPASSKRRPFASILASGVYEREKFVPHRPVVDRNKEKEKLQNIMAYNKNLEEKSKSKEVIKKEKDEPTPNRYDQLVEEIKERQQWLDDMEELGEGHKYKDIINQQIQSRLREMKKLKLSNDN